MNEHGHSSYARKNRLFVTFLLGLVLGLPGACGTAQAQGLDPKLPKGPENPIITSFPFASCVKPASACCATCDPIADIPNFFGDFFARGAQARYLTPGTNTFTTQTLTYTAAIPLGAARIPPVPAVPFTFFGPFTFTGPGGPFVVNSNVTGTITVLPLVALNENAELTGKIQGSFPTAVFANGTGDAAAFTLLYNYLLTTGQITPGQQIVVNLADPAGGGLVGRNKYFDNGSPLPQDRVYFFYNHVGDFRGLGSDLSINRYVFGVEKTFFNNNFSVELRAPFAGTANSDQVAGSGLSVSNVEFGDLGLVLKAALLRTPNFLVSAGMGVSLPTADDSRLFLNGQSVLEIQNKVVLLQPLLGVAWAPNSRFYTQAGLQFDLAPSGNPVVARDMNNNMNRVGVLRDSNYAFASAAAGYWVYENRASLLSRVGLQGELHYDRSFGSSHAVQNGPVSVTDLNSRVDVLNATTGVICELGERARLSVGVSFPLTGDRLYDWNLIAQVNYRFGYRAP